MGYTHYYYTKPTISKEKWDKLINDVEAMVVNSDIIQKEYNDNSLPIVNNEKICFNGKGEAGHETFVLLKNDTHVNNDEKVFNFCKTACKPYDTYVTAVLLLAKIHLEDEIDIASNGEISKWHTGVSLIKSKLGKIIEIIPNKDNDTDISKAAIKEVNI